MDPLPPYHEHDGLVLRRWTPDDAPLLQEAIVANIEHLRPWMAWISFEPQTVEQRRQMLETWEQVWLAGGAVAMVVLEDGRVVGGTGLNRRIGPTGLDIGYWVHVDHLGQRIASRASEGLTDLAFTVPGIDHVEIHHDPGNLASRRTPERLGFTEVGSVQLDRPLAPAETGTDIVWRVTKDEWLAR